MNNNSNHKNKSRNESGNDLEDIDSLVELVIEAIPIPPPEIEKLWCELSPEEREIFGVEMMLNMVNQVSSGRYNLKSKKGFKALLKRTAKINEAGLKQFTARKQENGRR